MVLHDDFCALKRSFLVFVKYWIIRKPVMGFSGFFLPLFAQKTIAKS